MSDMRKLINLMEGVQAVPGVGTQLDERNDSPLRDINDYRARMKELQRIQLDPDTSKDPQLKAELTRKKVTLDTQAREMGFVSEDSTDNELESLKARANQESKNGYVQHVNKRPDGSYYISDWYDSDETVASYENGRDLMGENQSQAGINEDDREIKPGAKVYPRWSQKGEPMEVVGMTESGRWVCVDDFGNRGSMSGEDLVLAPKQQVAAEDIEKPAQVVSCDQSNPAAARDACAMEEDINNGYDDVHYATGGDYFPNGADGPVVKAVGPSGARQGDNPEQKKMQVAETHKELVYSYRNYLKESSKKS